MIGYINVYLDEHDNFTFRSYRLVNGVGIRNTKYGSFWAPLGAVLVPDGKGDLEIAYSR